MANGWVNLGVVLRRRGEVEHAELAYNTALEVDPRALSAYQNMVSLLKWQGRIEEAKDFETVLRRAPSCGAMMRLLELSQALISTEVTIRASWL